MSAGQRRASQAGSEQRSFWLVALVLSVGVVWAIWAVPYLPTNDGPQHVLSVHMEAHYDDPGSIYREQLELGYAVAGRGFALIYGPLREILPWPVALRVVESLAVLAWGWAAVLLAWALHRRRRLAGLLGLGTAFVWPLYMGFFSFTLGMGFGLLVAAAVVRRRTPSWLERAAVSVALLVTLVLHPFAAVVAGLIVAAVVLVRVERRKPELMWLGASALPILAVLAWMMGDQAELAQVGHSEQSGFAPLGTAIRQLPQLLVPGPTLRGVAAIVLCVVAWVLLVKRLRRGSTRPEELALGGVAAVFFLVGGFGPLHLPGWQLVSPRLLPVALVLSVALLPWEQIPSSRARYVAAAAVALAALGSVITSERLHQRLAAGCADAWAGLQQPIERSFLQLPIVLDASCGLAADPAESEVPYLQPLVHVGCLFAVAHGGSVPYLFVGPGSVHAFKPRRRPLVPIPSMDLWGISADAGVQDDPAIRREVLTLLAGYGAPYENILVFGARPEDRQLLVERGYAIDFERGTHLNAHLEPCELELAIPLRPTDGRLLVQYGPAGLPASYGQVVIEPPAAQREAQSATAVTQIKTLCGALWIRVRLPAPELRCANADSQGRIEVRASRAGARVRCERGGREPTPVP